MRCVGDRDNSHLFFHGTQVRSVWQHRWVATSFYLYLHCPSKRYVRALTVRHQLAESERPAATIKQWSSCRGSGESAVVDPAPAITAKSAVLARTHAYNVLEDRTDVQARTPLAGSFGEQSRTRHYYLFARTVQEVRSRQHRRAFGVGTGSRAHRRASLTCTYLPTQCGVSAKHPKRFSPQTP
ncbi:hypothetical protein ACJJTC_014715 [Scirpophaga incertulas]